MNFTLRSIRIVKVEERPRDAWVDMSLRQLREGEVRFYRVDDPLTGRWLFKVCPDGEMDRTMVKALKCPPGRAFTQLEGSTMLFQRAPEVEGKYYDVISVSYIDEDGRLRRNVVERVDEIPPILRENFEVKTYEEATGRRAPGKRLVALCGEKDEKAMITLFLLERAWPISELTPEAGLNTRKVLNLIRELEKAEIGEVYREAERRYGLQRESIDKIIDLLERDGKILRPGENYLKTKR